MKFATVQDMITRYGEQELIQATDHAGLNRIDVNQVEVALQDATNELEGYIAQRITLPLNPVPGILVKRTCEIARYNLHEDRATDRMDIDYNNAIRWARDVAKGAVTLNDGTVQADTSNNLDVNVHQGERVFSDDILKRMP